MAVPKASPLSPWRLVRNNQLPSPDGVMIVAFQPKWQVTTQDRCWTRPVRRRFGERQDGTQMAQRTKGGIRLLPQDIKFVWS